MNFACLFIRARKVKIDRRATKHLLVHSSTVLLTVDLLKAVGVVAPFVGHEVYEHFAHFCAASGGVLGVVACYFDAD